MAGLLPIVFLNCPNIVTTIYYALGIATDMADGYIARKYNLYSNTGKWLDPLADKSLNIMMAGLLALFVNPLLFIPIGFEAAIVSITGVRKLVNQGIDNMNISKIGKIKTWALALCIIFTLLSRSLPGLQPVALGALGLTITTQLAVSVQYGCQMIKDIARTINNNKDNNDNIENVNSIDLTLNKDKSLDKDTVALSHDKDKTDELTVKDIRDAQKHALLYVKNQIINGVMRDVDSKENSKENVARTYKR